MSSNRGAGPCDATVLVHDQQVGVIRLPEHRADDFIEQFNRTYLEIGMALHPLPKSMEIEDDKTEQKKSPPANDADGDFVD